MVKDQPTLSGEFVVRDHGAYLQPLVGEIELAGLTPTQAASALSERLRGILTQPSVTVAISQPRTLFVSVLGEVRAPGFFELPTREGVLGALARAGGLTEFARPSHIYLLRRTPERARIRFSLDDLEGGRPRSASFELQDGDIVFVH